VQTPDSRRLAVGVLLCINAGDVEGLELLVSAMTDAERAAVIASLGELAHSGVLGRTGSPEAARQVLTGFAENISSE